MQRLERALSMGYRERRSVVPVVLLVVLALLVGWWLGVRSRPTPALPEPPPMTFEQASTQLRTSSEAFAAVARVATPSVVNISAATIIPGRRSPLFDDPLFRYFFGDEDIPFRQPERVVRSLGSGVIVSRDGLILTNNHVIAGASRISVTLADGRRFADAQVVGTDPATDLALLRIRANNLPAIKWGDSRALEVGEWVLAIGNPYGLSQTVTAGIVSAKGRRDVGISVYEDFIQTDAAINPGNSGGALVNIRGELVGINTAILSQSGGNVGIGFAVPSHEARRVMELLLRDGRVSRGWLGIIPARVEEGAVQGVIVANLFRNSPADLAGLDIDDIILECNGRRVTSPGDLKNMIASMPAGTEVTLLIQRGMERGRVRLRVADHPTDRFGRPVPGI
ncbi:MAG: trypsin-like peptidase domain-containing protein [Armatimonadota bacterium]|nr:trypsin-like peptidase domain-containing protein [Armatimonadota bacterium]MDW8105540.1 trypsin-like peptidase domain-containing protein [Armatimonadota bacterium]MDW8290611.1 trypsin-like peptidase domain-containing protein [Armatimonadota bacterium]